ncbi:MAG: GMC family oxidoreductase [Pedobacter sp.]|nr:MAG: GMC family oxidoreductase [Pedobacter sp.]
MPQKNIQISFDLCVIGSGPTGIIIVLEYLKLNPNHKVLLLEYGFSKQKSNNKLDDSVLVNNRVNHHEPYECTNKGLGGTSLTWGGRCVMYDEVDFMKRNADDTDCTWDLNLFNEVKTHLPMAANYFECGEPLFNLNEIPAFKNNRIAEHFEEGIVTDSAIERWSMPTRFGKRYGNELKNLKTLTLLEGYEARDFGAPDEKGKVSTLGVRNVLSNTIKTIKASNFVIAAGTQETTRILLRNEQLFKRLTNIPPALGKYYQCHLLGKIASVIFNGNPKKTNYGFLRNTDGTYIRRRFQFDGNYLLGNNLMNTAFWLDNPLYFDPAHKNGAMSLMYLAMLIPVLGKKLAPPAIAHSITKGETKDVKKHILNILKDLPGSLSKPATIFFKRYMLKRKLPGVFLYNPNNSYALNFHAEQTPFSENRMELGDDGETLVIHYEISEKDIESVIKLHETLDKWLRSKGCGELKYWYKKEELAQTIKKISKDGIHQIGTTRIGNSPEEGVVDRDLKLWGTQNVYVCSSSVFPKSGQANPTFFLGAFAVRLANFLK